MAGYSVGYNQDPGFLELTGAFKDSISEVYFPAAYSLMGSGRALVQKKGYVAEIRKLIKRCSLLGIRSNILLNATCEGKSSGEKGHADRIISGLKKLKSIGLTSVTVTNPAHIRRIKDEVGELEIHSSVNCYVKTVEHAEYLKELGVDVLTIDRDINRDIPLIKDIKEMRSEEHTSELQSH